MCQNPECGATLLRDQVKCFECGKPVFETDKGITKDAPIVMTTQS